MTRVPAERPARIVGRTLRLLMGVGLVWLTYDAMRSASGIFNWRVAAAVVGLATLYALVHVGITKYLPGINPWLGAVVAVVPVVLVFVLGGPLGRVASVAFIGISLVLQGIRGDGGCEVMSIPGILFGRRTHLVCIAFSPIDWLEERLAG